MNFTEQLKELQAAELMAAEDKRREAAEIASAWTEYYSRLQEYHKLPVGKRNDFNALRKKLGVTDDEFKNHRDIRAKHVSLRLQAQEMSAQGEVVSELEDRVEQINQTFAAAQMAHNHQLPIARDAAALARNRLDTIQKAARDAQALETEHWQVLGLADPSADQRRRHIAHIYRDQPLPKGACEVLSFESLMVDPFRHGNPASFEFAPMDDQAADEFKQVSEVVLYLANNKRAGLSPVRAAYLVPDDFKPTVAQSGDGNSSIVIRLSDWIEEYATAWRGNPEGFRQQEQDKLRLFAMDDVLALCHPGCSEEEFQKNRKTIERARANRLSRLRNQPEPTEQQIAESRPNYWMRTVGV